MAYSFKLFWIVYMLTCLIKLCLVESQREGAHWPLFLGEGFH
ncbi:hypothetical protein PTUN_b0653 [Pseudoalteromonas tunicata]|jgi:hypothetical protein|uniref:Uncharacterized protein n=1 Tax=Pseudoalteromonas tunicata D2 TaxID=87626 RepID=A4C4N9_9GAMM|nr:hypothetical protein PTUN_b0653 [Pseudoalteromonas tunicata]EAR30521.1 hypothetical protein PTD2_03091 [Pseudoalteromonas tunicata D2]